MYVRQKQFISESDYPELYSIIDDATKAPETLLHRIHMGAPRASLERYKESGTRYPTYGRLPHLVTSHEVASTIIHDLQFFREFCGIGISFEDKNKDTSELAKGYKTLIIDKDTRNLVEAITYWTVSYTHLTLPTIYSV